MLDVVLGLALFFGQGIDKQFEQETDVEFGAGATDPFDEFLLARANLRGGVWPVPSQGFDAVGTGTFNLCRTPVGDLARDSAAGSLFEFVVLDGEQQPLSRQDVGDGLRIGPDRIEKNGRAVGRQVARQQLLDRRDVLIARRLDAFLFPDEIHDRRPLVGGHHFESAVPVRQSPKRPKLTRR